MMVLKLREMRGARVDRITRFYAAKSVRMCIACRQRDLQKNLIRFKVMESFLQLYDGSGRSFYVCVSCLPKPKTQQSIKKILKKAENLQQQIEEIVQICQK